MKKVQRIATYGLATMDDKVLLVRIGKGIEAEIGTWMLPGGGVEHGERPEDAVVRELAEETGLSVKVDRLLEVGSDHRMIEPDVDFHCVFLLYAVTVTGGRLAGEPDGTTSTPTWTPVADLTATPLLASSEVSLRRIYGEYMI